MAALFLLIIGCTPGTHTIRPYCDDPEKAMALEKRAEEACGAEGKGVPAGISIFATDGCTLYPDRDWVDCCVKHDMDYWCGGSKQDRRESDLELRRCVTEKGYAGNGSFMYRMVRIGGHPLLPLPWRWGYGWRWPRSYEDPEEGREAGP